MHKGRSKFGGRKKRQLIVFKEMFWYNGRM